MKNRFLYLIVLALLTSCNSLSDDFFQFLFNSKSIRLTRECEDNPSIFSEGRSFEIYSLSEKNAQLAIQGILNKSRNVDDKKFRYKTPQWQHTPVKNDSTDAFIESEITEDRNRCFDHDELTKVLKQKGNYYSFLRDDLGRIKLFILDIRKRKLFLLTSYEV